MNVRKTVWGAGLAVALFATLLVSSARAQLGGTVWIDFVPDNLPMNYPDTATIGQQSAFSDSLKGLDGLAGLTNAQVQQVETDVTTIVQNKFGSLSVNITSNAGDPSAAMPPAPPMGNYTLVVVGDAAGANAGTLGQASQIDWRNLSFNDKIGVSVAAFDGFTNPPDSEWSVAPTDTIATALANTIAHEIGHTMGLVHDDAAAGYATATGTDAQKKAAVQSSDLMRANVLSLAAATSTTTAFNNYSKLKLDVATHGIQLENQAAAIAQGLPGTADPLARTADTNTSMATATPLINDPRGTVNVLGNIGAGNFAAIDWYSFNGQAGQTVDLEVYALGLEQEEGDTDSGRIAPNGSIGANTLILVNATNNEIVRSMSPETATGTNYDGSNRPNDYGDALIYGVSLPATGTYYVEVEGSKAGQYELFAVVPEPSSVVLAFLGVGGAAVIALRRRQSALTTRPTPN